MAAVARGGSTVVSGFHLKGKRSRDAVATVEEMATWGSPLAGLGVGHDDDLPGASSETGRLLGAQTASSARARQRTAGNFVLERLRRSLWRERVLGE